MSFWAWMDRRKRLTLAALGACWGCAALQAQAGPWLAVEERHGVVVEEVERGSSGERAGLRSGDLLLGWSRSASGWANPLPTAGTFATHFDFDEVLIEQAPRGALTLSGFRSSVARSWSLPAGAAASRIGVRCRPPLAPPAQSLYEEGGRRIAVGDARGGAELWHQGATLASSDGRWDVTAWLLERRAEALTEARFFGAADRAWAEAVAAERRAGRTIAAVLTLGRWAESLWRQARWGEAQSRSAQAVGLASALAGHPLALATAAFSRAETLRQSGSLAQAEAAHRGALGLWQAESPGSLAEADGYYGLGRVLSTRFQDAEARAALESAALLQERLAPESLSYARTLDAMGVLSRARGQFPEAERRLQTALRIALGHSSPYDAGRAYLHLSQISSIFGDLPRTRELLLEARRCFEGLPEDSLILENRTFTYLMLGPISSAMGDALAARRFGQDALRIQAGLNAGSIEMAQALEGMGATEKLEGNFRAAREYFERALAIKEALHPGSLTVAVSLTQLGSTMVAEGLDLERAERLLRRAAALEVELSGRHRPSAACLLGLAAIARLRGHMEESLAQTEQAVRQLEEIAPSGDILAVTLDRLGRTEREMGRLTQAREHLCRAATMLDQLDDQLAWGPTLRSEFAAAYAPIHFDCLASLIESGAPAEAFRVLENGRARAFLSLIASRDLYSAELPPELARERAGQRSAYRAALAELSGPNAPRDSAAQEALRLRLAEMQRGEEAFVDRVRRESPRFADLHFPLPLDLAGTRAVLDPGTTLLAYAVGESESFLFVVRPLAERNAGLSAFRLGVGEGELRREIRALTALLSGPRTDRTALRSSARRLYAALIGPAESLLASSHRLLLAPDGPLHALPFALLVRRDGRSLIEWKPIHTVISATVYAELRKRRTAAVDPRKLQVVAFGDPSYPQFSSANPEAAADLRLRSALRRGLRLTPLPSSRREVEALKALYPNAKIFVGSEANEERAKALGPGVRIIHFAGHALVDEDQPLTSALALAIPESPLPGRDDGLLQSWEIFEQMRIDADLVTLSACNTALGKEMGGEGLVGLTRAFQFAGARSILASLWAIGDGSTARFMPRFYQHLRSGLAKDEALRQTQIEWLRDPRTAHPYYWAAFELIGDFR